MIEDFHARLLGLSAPANEGESCGVYSNGSLGFVCNAIKGHLGLHTAYAWAPDPVAFWTDDRMIWKCYDQA